MFFTTLQSIWYFFLSIETMLSIMIIMATFFILCANILLLFSIYDKNRKHGDRYFKFDTTFKWIKPTTLYIPFEFNVLVCNYVMIRLAILGKGIEVKLQWFDAVSVAIDETIKSQKGDVKDASKGDVKDVLNKSIKKECSSKGSTQRGKEIDDTNHQIPLKVSNKDKLKKVSQLDITLLIDSGKYDTADTQKNDLNSNK